MLFVPPISFSTFNEKELCICPESNCKSCPDSVKVMQTGLPRFVLAENRDSTTQVYRIKLVVILPVDLRSQADDLRHDRTEQPFRPMRIIQPLPFLLQMFNLPIDLLAALVALRFMQAVARNDILNSIILCIPTAPQGLPVPFPRSAA